MAVYHQRLIDGVCVCVCVFVFVCVHMGVYASLHMCIHCSACVYTLCVFGCVCVFSCMCNNIMNRVYVRV